MAHPESYMPAGDLRRQAESILKGRRPDLEGFSPQDLQGLVHELQVHQVELELQNEALRETQQALELARDEYLALYDGAPIGYFTVDGDGVIARANATGAALLAAGPNALPGRAFYSLVAPEDQDAYHFFLVRLSRSGGPESVELSVVRSDGTRFQARIEGVRSTEEQRDHHRWRAALSDVTAEHEARRTLQRYADEQSALYAVAAALATSLDPVEVATQVLDVLLPMFAAAAGWVAVTGGAPEEPRRILASRGIDAGSVAPDDLGCPGCVALLSGDPAGRAAPAEAVLCEQDSGGALAQAGLHSVVCVPLVTSSLALGVLSLAWEAQHALEDRDQTLLQAVGKQVGLALYNARLHQQARQVDRLETLVTLDRALSSSLELETVAGLALKGAATAVQASEAFLLPYVDWLRNAPGKILTLDQGWTDPAASGKYGRWQGLLETLRQDRMASGDEGGVWQSTTPWGSELVGVAIKDRDGPLAGLVLSGRTFSREDVTVARAAAGRIGQALRNARLYGEVRDLLRQREETQALLIQTEKVAALGRLSASLSHEINNPLQSVLGCLGLAQNKLESAGDDDRVNRYVTVAMQEIRRVATLVHRMREFYSPVGEERELGDVEEVLVRVVDLTSGELKGRKVDVAWKRGERLPEVPMHADRMQRVFLNLILNAAEAMPEGGTVILHTGRDEMPGGADRTVPAVRIDLQDTGQGIPPEVQPHLFEPFVTSKPAGSGLGLYVCQYIVRDHGGRIEIHSRQGTGTTATVWLPLAPDS